MIGVTDKSCLNKGYSKNLLSRQRFCGNAAQSGCDNRQVSTAGVNAENLKAYHLVQLPKLSFGRSLKEHESWGATVNPDKAVNFKIWFPGAKEINVEVAKYENAPESNIVNGKKISWSIDKDVRKSRMIALESKGDGIFETQHLRSVKNGDMYRYIITKNDGSIIKLDDPYSRQQPNIFSWSKVYDHNAYKWNDSRWMKDFPTGNGERVSHTGRPGYLKPNQLVIKEIHVGTVTKDGSFEAAKKVIDEVKKQGYNAVELMPWGTTFGKNWGYDETKKFSPNESLGGPNGLKKLVDYAHKQGVNVIFDLVPNHLGVHGNSLNGTAYTTDDKGNPINTPWGTGFAYEHSNIETRQKVRDYFSNMLLEAGKYHADGIRLDMTKHMNSYHALQQGIAEIRYHNPHTVIMLEHGTIGTGLDRSASTPFKKFEPTACLEGTDHQGRPVSEEAHVNTIYKLDENKTQLPALGADSQWDFPFHHVLINLLMDQDVYNGYDTSLGKFKNIISDNTNSTKYLASHDEIGNNDGQRFISRSLFQMFKMWEKTDENHGITDNNERTRERARRAAYATQKFLEASLYGSTDVRSGNGSGKDSELIYDSSQNGKPSIWDFNIQKRLFGFNQAVKEADFKPAVNYAIAQHKLGLGVVLMSPGPKLIFQGDDSGKINRFSFFRKEPDPQDPASFDNGYDVASEHISNEAKIHDKKDKPELKTYFEDLMKLYNDPTNSALHNDDNYVACNEEKRILGIKRSDEKADIVALANFSKDNQTIDLGHIFNKLNGEYYNLIPNDTAQWEIILNSGDKKYGGDGLSVSKDSKVNFNSISLPQKGMIILRRKK